MRRTLYAAEKDRRRQQYINGWLNRFSIFFIGVMPTSVRMLVKHKMLDKNIRKP